MRRAHRLRRPADFQRVRGVRRSWGHPLLVLYAAPNDGLPTRFGISVGKRVGKAVTRNRVKRRVREAVRLRLAVLRPGYDLVFIARPPAADAPWASLRDATEDLLRRARLIEGVPPRVPIGGADRRPPLMGGTVGREMADPQAGQRHADRPS